MFFNLLEFNLLLGPLEIFFVLFTFKFKFVDFSLILLQVFRHTFNLFFERLEHFLEDISLFIMVVIQLLNFCMKPHFVIVELLDEFLIHFNVHFDLLNIFVQILEPDCVLVTTLSIVPIL